MISIMTYFAMLILLVQNFCYCGSEKGCAFMSIVQHNCVVLHSTDNKEPFIVLAVNSEIGFISATLTVSLLFHCTGLAD